MKIVMRLVVPALMFLAAFPASAFYDPTIGKWISRDPVGERAGPNICEFVHNRPIISFDPVGLAATGPVDGTPVPIDSGKLGEGAGPIVVRWYTLQGSCCSKGCAEIMKQFKENLSSLAHSSWPGVDSSFHVIGGGDINDGVTIQIDGPGDINPYIKVIGAGGNDVRFRTLKGHPEIGDIEFYCGDSDSGGGKKTVTFAISSITQAATPKDLMLYTMPIPITGPIIEPIVINDPDPLGNGSRGIGYMDQTLIWRNLLGNIGFFGDCGKTKKEFGDRWLYDDPQKFGEKYYQHHNHTL